MGIVNHQLFRLEIEFQRVSFIVGLDISVPKGSKRTDRKDGSTFNELIWCYIGIIFW
jgi:hypothetical protein